MEKWQQEGFESFRAWRLAKAKADRAAKKALAASTSAATAEPTAQKQLVEQGDAGSRIEKIPDAKIEEVLEVTMQLAPMLDSPPKGSC
jgi:hypothetical protein